VREATVVGQSTREVFYEITEPPLQNFEMFGSRSLIVPARDVLHIKLKTPRHPLVGVTWLQALAPELAARLAINKSATTFANNMSRPSGVLQTDLVLTKAQVDEMRALWNEHAQGMNAGGVPILTRGLKFNPVSVSNVDAQIVEQLKLSDRAVAAVFGVPPMIVCLADGGTVKSAEAQMQEWLNAGLGWLINHIEKSFDAFFGLDVVPAGREWTQFDEKVLLRTDFKARVEAEVRGVQGGIFAPNEARELEGLPPVQAGDEPRVQQQLLPLSAVTEPSKPTPAPAPAPDDREREESRAVLAYQLRKAVRQYERAA
jgi:HK97 family phage portal protein